MERLPVHGVESPVLLEHQAAGTPAKEGELHGMRVPGKGERVVLAEDFRFPMHRVMTQENPEHAFSAFRCHREVAFRREVARW